MHVLIEKDGEQESVEVADEAEAQALADQGHTVLVPNKDGGHRPLASAIIAAAVDGFCAEVEAHITGKPAAKKATAKKAAPKAPAKKAKK